MLRNVASKVMWVGRATVFMVGVAVILALAVGVVSRATAHTGSAGLFHLNHNNPVTALSTLTGTLTGAVLKVDNNGTGPALSLEANSGQAPLRVNATAGKATNLDADKLDGKDSTELAPILRSQQDGSKGGQGVTGTTEVNSVAIQAPVNGVLMISGTAYVNSWQPAAINYVLNPKVDGSNATPDGWGAYYSADVGDPLGGGAPGSRFTLTYTVSQPVNAGSHTVTQELGQLGGAPVNFFYNNNELSVEFVPGTQASVSDAATLGAAQDSGLSPTGEPK